MAQTYGIDFKLPSDAIQKITGLNQQLNDDHHSLTQKKYIGPFLHQITAFQFTLRMISAGSTDVSELKSTEEGVHKLHDEVKSIINPDTTGLHFHSAETLNTTTDPLGDFKKKPKNTPSTSTTSVIKNLTPPASPQKITGKIAPLHGNESIIIQQPKKSNPWSCLSFCLGKNAETAKDTSKEKLLPTNTK